MLHNIQLYKVCLRTKILKMGTVGGIWWGQFNHSIYVQRYVCFVLSYIKHKTKYIYCSVELFDVTH